MKNNGFKWVIIVLLLGMIGYLAYMLLQEPGREIGVLKKAPDFTLEDLNGNQVSLADTAGKAKLVYFYYSTCPDVCLPTTYTLSKIQDKLKEKGVFGSDTAIVSITFDPTKDTRERLQEFSKMNNADLSGWYFLRNPDNDEAAAMQLATDYGILVVKDPQGDTFTHTNYILLVDGKGNIRTYYLGDDPDLDLDLIVNDLIQVSKE
ncbi:SCO family protein [Paenibacillus ginsengihumi]|mgnify:CR=1 FL=1|uniref:SCO family protein n=1 Tax=Paenibacillus ginsengihumi TaxID=431596 RepID=UPI0003666D44|nr:SCO family protein [Paenibacillus ginsengihumi]